MHPWQRNSVFLLIALILAGGLAQPDPAGAGLKALNPALTLSNLAGSSGTAAMAVSPLTGDLLIVWEEHGLADREEIAGRLWHRHLA